MEAGSVDAFRRFRMATLLAFVGFSLAGSAAAVILHDGLSMAAWVTALVVAVSAGGAVTSVLGFAHDLAVHLDGIGEVVKRAKLGQRAAEVEARALQAEVAELRAAATREPRRRETDPW